MLHVQFQQFCYSFSSVLPLASETETSFASEGEPCMGRECVLEVLLLSRTLVKDWFYRLKKQSCTIVSGDVSK